MDGVVAFLTAKDVPGKNLAINGENKEVLLDHNELVMNNIYSMIFQRLLLSYYFYRYYHYLDIIQFH